jgi:hypothetical protein
MAEMCFDTMDLDAFHKGNTHTRIFVIRAEHPIAAWEVVAFPTTIYLPFLSAITLGTIGMRSTSISASDTGELGSSSTKTAYKTTSTDAFH